MSLLNLTKNQALLKFAFVTAVAGILVCGRERPYKLFSGNHEIFWLVVTVPPVPVITAPL